MFGQFILDLSTLNQLITTLNSIEVGNVAIKRDYLNHGTVIIIPRDPPDLPETGRLVAYLERGPESTWESSKVIPNDHPPLLAPRDTLLARLRHFVKSL